MISQACVSVIVPNFNYSAYVGKAIKSVLEQTYGGPTEIIVVDDGSTDDSLEVLAGFGQDVKIISTPNLGQSSARNSGIGAARGEFIALLDADDEWLPTKLEEQVQLFSDPEVGLVYSGVWVADGTEHRTMLPRHTGRCHGAFLRNPTEAIVLCGESTAVIRKSVVDATGPFDTSLSISAGWDFYRRASRITCFDAVRAPLAIYRQHGGNASANLRRYRRDVRHANQKMRRDLPADAILARLTARATLEASLVRTSIGTARRKYFG